MGDFADRISGISTSVAVKAPVRVATLVDITLAGLLTVDGVTVAPGERVLVRAQANPQDNGIYDVNALAWTRSKDFDGARDVVEGTLIYVIHGDTWNDTYFRVTTTDNPILFGDSAISFAASFGGGELPPHLEDPAEVYLADDEAYLSSRAIDAAPAIQALINGFAVGSAIKVFYPSGVTYQSDVSTAGRIVQFIGLGRALTTIIPVTITLGTFNLNDPSCVIKGMAIDDSANSMDLPGFILPGYTLVSGRTVPNDQRALVRVGHGASTLPRNCVIKDIGFLSSRALGLNYEGGSVLLIESCVWGQCASGGWWIPEGNGDTNHWKIRNSTFTGCFNFNADLGGATTNSGGAGWFENTKFYGGENYNLKVAGDANGGQVFVELANSYRQIGSLTLSSNVMTVPREQTASLSLYQVFNNGSTGLPNGTYITGLDKNAGTVTLSENATQDTTNVTYTSFTQSGMRNPSCWVTATALGNDIHIIGDTLDPAAIRDDTPAGSNLISFVNSGNGQQYVADLNARKWRLTSSETQTGDPNNALNFTAFATFTAGVADFVMSDPLVLNRIRYGGTLSSVAFTANTTVSSVNVGTATVTPAAAGANTIKTGTYLVGFRPTVRGGYVMSCFDDLQIMRLAAGPNVAQNEVTLGRGSRYVGTTDSTTTLLMKRFDTDFESPSAGKALYCHDPAIIPDGTKISSVSGPDANGIYTVVMDTSALLSRTGVVVQMYNTNVGQMRETKPCLPVFTANPTPSAGARLGEQYVTTTGENRTVVPLAQDGRYQISWDPSNVAALGFIKYSTDGAAPGTFSADSNSKALTNVVLGDKALLFGASRDLSGLRVDVVITATNTMDITLFNMSAGAINLGSTIFYIEHKRR